MRYLSIIVLAALIVTTSVRADEQSIVFFGNFRGSFNAIDDSRCGAQFCIEQNDHKGVSFRNNASTLGLRGTRTVENKTAYFKYILRAHNDEIFARGALSTIIYQAGLKGPWGDVSVGVGSTPYKASGMALDPFWDTSASARGFDGPTIGFSDLTWGFTKNMVQWNSAQLWETLTLSAAVIVDDTNANAHDINLGAQQRVGSLYVGLQFLSMSTSHPTAKSLRSGHAVRAWSRWSSATPFTISASIERIDYEPNGERPALDSLQLHYALTLVYKRNASRWALALGRASAQELPYLHGSGGSIGWFYQLMPSVELYALSSYNSRQNGEPARRVSALGMSLDYGN